MALDYAALFGDLGRLIARLNSYSTLGGTTLPADLLTLETQFGTRWLPPEGIASAYGGMQRQVSAWRQQIAAYADRRLTDADLVLTPLGLGPGAGVDEALANLVRQMLSDGRRVKACVCAATTPAADPANRGDGTAWVTTVLDGYSAPLLGARSDVRYDGLASELCVPAETMTLECVADSVIDGLQEGAEQFTWTGGPQYDPLDVRPEGSGPGPSLTVASAGENLLSGGDFESWSGAVPSGWTVEAGAVTQDTTTFFRGASSLAVAGGQALVRLSQPITPGTVNGRRRYHVGLAMKASAAAPGATFRAYFASSSGTPVGGAIEVDGASFPTSWSQRAAFFGFPAPIPSTWKIVVEVANLPAGLTLNVDNASLVPVSYHGGVGCVITAGDLPFQRGDRLLFNVSNDGGGKIQTFFRQRYRTHLPSVAAGVRAPAGLTLLMQLLSWTIAESVADSQVV